MTRIDVMRHGEPDGGQCYRGSSVDDVLTDKGWLQMREAVSDQAPWQKIYSSPLVRCRAFAEELADEHNIPLTVQDNLKEVGFGTWEGRTPDDILQNEGDALHNFYQDPVNQRPPGAEPLHEFQSRVWDVYKTIAHESDQQHALIVAHAGITRAIISKILNMPLDSVYSCLKIEYAAIVSTIIQDDGTPRMVIRS